ncbi:MAG: hypothetical protein PVF81_00470, partial [Thioalkalispiraceae bacterium]
MSDNCRNSNKRLSKLVEVIESGDDKYQEGKPIRNAVVISKWIGHKSNWDLFVCMSGHCSHSECLSMTKTKTNENGEFYVDCLDKNKSYRPYNKPWPSVFDSISNEIVIMKKGYYSAKYKIFKKDIEYEKVPYDYHQRPTKNVFHNQPIKIDKFYLLKDNYFFEMKKNPDEWEKIKKFYL